jgi:hypothetical protein
MELVEAGTETANFLSDHVIDVFTLFRTQFPVPSDYYHLSDDRLVLAITNSVSDRDRAAIYHSRTGASSYKTAAFVGKWIAKSKPIQVAPTYPINQVNHQLLTVNATFAAYVVQSLLKKRMYGALFSDLQYCFEYRSLRGEEVNLLLDHALDLSPSFHAA